MNPDHGISQQATAARLAQQLAKWAVLLLPFAFFLLLPLACSSGPAWLTFQSTESDRQYSQRFSRAYFAREAGGEYQAVLIEDGLAPAPEDKTPAGPLHAASTAPLSQVVYLRILWQPLRGVKPDTPSATNAVIDWYVRSNDAAGRDDRLHYRGAGFVRIDDSGQEARFVIRNARVQLADSSGRLQDPLGQSLLTGSFTATRNDAMVAATLEALRQTSPGQHADQSNPPADSAAHRGPPPRAPTGP